MGHLQKNNVSTEKKVYVIKNLHKPLPERPAITVLKLLNRISSVGEQEKLVIEHALKTEPVIPFPFPDLPLQRVGMDLFEWNKLTSYHCELLLQIYKGS